MKINFSQINFNFIWLLSFFIHFSAICSLLLLINIFSISQRFTDPLELPPVMIVPHISSNSQSKNKLLENAKKISVTQSNDRQKISTKKATPPTDPFSLSAKKSSDFIEDLTLKKPETQKTVVEDVDILADNSLLSKDELDYLFLPDNKLTVSQADNLNQLSNAASNQSIEDSLRAYQAQLIKLVKKKWHPPKHSAPNKFPTVVAYINSQGNLLKYGLTVSSEDDTLNQSALDAVRRSNPFPDFPPDISSDKIFVVPFNFKNEYFIQ